ncbi:DUF881 domain-containing protein [Patescibacteria group bacterium]|nr:DUF881 domain-containing protein [Patescibacteria group bacterium]
MKAVKIVSVCAGILVGVLITVQFRTLVPLSSSYPLDQLQAQKDLIKEYADEESFLKSRIVSIRAKIDEKIARNNSTTQIANLETLNQLKEAIGLTALAGPGYTIELTDSPFVDRENINGDEQGIVYAADLRDVVNLLRIQGAKGIAINNERLIATSSISSVGNTILVNNSHLVPPFSISAVGNYGEISLRLESDVNALHDLKQRVKENGIKFSIKQNNHIILPIYNGQFRLKFVQNKITENILN